jgi:hypothetical protein
MTGAWGKSVTALKGNKSSQVLLKQVTLVSHARTGFQPHEAKANLLHPVLFHSSSGTIIENN